MRNKPNSELIDRIDRDILAHLQHDARISNKELAAKVGLAPSSCLARVKRLEGSGALLAFERHLATLPEVRGVFHVAGANDYLVHVAVRDADHLRELALNAFSTRAEVAHMETSLIFSHRRNTSFGTVPSGAPTARK
jgi:DNA-binding Lrp family transcriptional regulator